MDNLIDALMMNTGALFLVVGGLILIAAVIGILLIAVANIWISFSNKFRSICKAESLIFEYRKNRDMFLKWKGEQDG